MDLINDVWLSFYVDRQNGCRCGVILGAFIFVLFCFVVPPFVCRAFANPHVTCLREMRVIYEIILPEKCHRFDWPHDVMMGLLSKVNEETLEKIRRGVFKESLPWFDPWGNFYRCRWHPKFRGAKRFTIWSIGPDGIDDGGRGDDVVLTNEERDDWIVENYGLTQIFIQ